MNYILKNELECCGCTACANICPSKAIKMISDKEGFLYPKINIDMCCFCQKCKSVCPILSQLNIDSEDCEAVIARSENKDIVLGASSGGFIYELSKHVINNNGVVFGAMFDDSFKVIHECVRKTEDLWRFLGSKYVQSDLTNCYCRCKEILASNKLVLFIGTPCQIAGLKSFLGRDFKNLITTDFVCHGVPSPLVWERYKMYIEEKYNSKIFSCDFRDKTYGYRSTSMKICFENNKKYIESPRTDIMLKAFYKNALNRPVCSACKFKTVKHVCDFTCYDSWKAEKITNECKDDNLGYTNILLQSDKAKELVGKLQNIEFVRVGVSKILPVNGGMLLNSAKPYRKRNEFLRMVIDTSLVKAVQYYMPVSRKDRVIEKSKKILKFIGVMDYLSKIQVERKRRSKNSK